MITNDFNRLPKWLNVLILSRPEPQINIGLSKLKPLLLDGNNEKNKKDLYKYLSDRLKNEDVSKKKLLQILDKSEGNILYLKEVINEIRLKRLSLDDIESFPYGLTSVYEGYFSRKFPNLEEYERNQLPLIELLVASRKPFEITLMLDILNINLRTFKTSIEAMGSLVVEENKKIRFFHKSISDWITERASSKYFVDKNEGHRAIIRYMENNNSVKPEYLLDYLFYTYIDTEQYEKVVNILNTLDHMLLEKFGTYTTIIYYRNFLDQKLKKRNPINLGYLAKYEYFFGNFNKSIHLYKEAIKSTIEDEYLIEYYMNIGKANRNLTNTKKALKFYNKALDISNRIKNHKRINEQYGNLGNLHRAVCEYKTSIEYYNKAIKTSIKKKYTKNLTTHYSNLAIALYDTGQFIDSAKLFEASLEKEVDKRRKVITLSNLAHTLLDLGEYKVAYKYSQKACKIVEEIESDINLIYCNLAKGKYFLFCEEYDKAEKIFLTILDTSNRLKATREQNRVYTWLSLIYYLKKDYMKALQTIEVALKYYSHQDYHFTLCLYTLVQTQYEYKNKYAKKTILESMKIIKKSSNYYRAHYSMALSYFAIYSQKQQLEYLLRGVQSLKVAYDLTGQSKYTLAFYLKLLPQDEKIINRIKKEI